MAHLFQYQQRAIALSKQRTGGKAEVLWSLCSILNITRSEPATRGTFRLIFSCITTLTTCVYTAIHLNVPKQDTKAVARYTRKAKWVGLGILAPELVVYTALAQWYSARTLQKEVNAMIGKKVL